MENRTKQTRKKTCYGPDDFIYIPSDASVKASVCAESCDSVPSENDPLFLKVTNGNIIIVDKKGNLIAKDLLTNMESSDLLHLAHKHAELYIEKTAGKVFKACVASTSMSLHSPLGLWHS